MCDPGLGSRADGVPRSRGIRKVPTGIRGLDEVLRGGLPAGRPSLVCGGPGTGKSVLAAEFLGRGATRYDAPGVLVSFEQRRDDLVADLAGLDLGVREALAGGRLRVESVLLDPGEAVAVGEFDLGGLTARLDRWIDDVGASRLALDGVDALLAWLPSAPALRPAFGALCRWIRERGITSVLASGRGGDGVGLSTHGVEEYVSDCVVVLDHRVAEQISKRRLRVVKYRGSGHGVDEYPFVIGAEGFSVLPITSLGLDAGAPEDIVPSGVEGLDRILSGGGYFRGSTVLVTGTAGTGKSTLAARFAEGVCRRGGRCLYLAFEESAAQLVRNMRSVGIDLRAPLDAGSLRVDARRPTEFGLEEHLVAIQAAIAAQRPEAVVMDPITNFVAVGDRFQVKSMLLRVLDHLKHAGVTVVMTSLTPGAGSEEGSEAAVSSLVDSWIVIRYRRDRSGRRHRELHVQKARGMAHSEELFELVMSSQGPQVRVAERATEGQ